MILPDSVVRAEIPEGDVMKKKQGRKKVSVSISLSLLQIVKRVKNTCALLFNGPGDTMS